MKTAISLCATILEFPISMYIQYSLLQAIHADRLLMFLFWVNWPLIIMISIIAAIGQAKK